MILLALGLPHAEIENIAPWMRDANELLALIAKAKRFKPTREKFGNALKFTFAEWKAYRTRSGRRLMIMPCDATLEALERERAREKAAKQKQKRQQRAAALAAQCRNPRETGRN